MDKPAVSYAPHPDVTPEAEANALSAVFRFILDCHAKKKGGPDQKAAPDNAERRSNHVGATTIIPK